MGTGVVSHFEMHRDDDISGVSGEGLVAEGWQFEEGMSITLPDGSLVKLDPGWCCIRWKGARQSTVFWNSFEDAEAVHGHGGATRFVWDELLPTTETAEVRE